MRPPPPTCAGWRCRLSLTVPTPPVASHRRRSRPQLPPPTRTTLSVVATALLAGFCYSPAPDGGACRGRGAFFRRTAGGGGGVRRPPSDRDAGHEGGGERRLGGCRGCGESGGGGIASAAAGGAAALGRCCRHLSRRPRIVGGSEGGGRGGAVPACAPFAALQLVFLGSRRLVGWPQSWPRRRRHVGEPV